MYLSTHRVIHEREGNLVVWFSHSCVQHNVKRMERHVTRESGKGVNEAWSLDWFLGLNYRSTVQGRH